MGGARTWALAVAVGVVTATATPALGEEQDHGAFVPPLGLPALAPAFEQDPPLPENCDLPSKDSAAFKALGRSPGPTAVAHHGGGRVLDPQPAGAPYPQVFPTGDVGIEPNIGVTSSGALFVDGFRCSQAPSVY